MDKQKWGLICGLIVLMAVAVIVLTLNGLYVAIVPTVISIFALAISVSKEFILPSIWKPKIQLEAVNDGECIQSSPHYEDGPRITAEGSIDASQSKHRIDSNWLSLRIKNIGNATAMGVYCKLVKMRNQKTGELIGPFNPAPLNWTVYPRGTLGIKLAKEEYHLVNLISQQNPNEYVIPETVSIPNSLFEQLKDKLGAGEYIFEVTVYGDNIEPLPRSVEVHVGKNYEELKFLKEIKK